jgi:uncharacterized membrane protein YbhN (UPF0104 family)
MRQHSVNDSTPASVARPLWRRGLKPTIVTAALALVFGWLLPQFVDYQEVWEALTQLDAWELVVLLGLGLARVPTEALLYRLPPPSASVVQFGYFRGGGYASDAAGLAALGSFLFPTIGRFLLPLVALALLLVTGEVSGSILLAGGLSLALSAIAGIAGYYFLRSERSARWLGAKAQRPLSWVLVKLKRDPIEDGAGRATELRTQALAVLREGWALGSIGLAANLFLTYLILLAALRFVGVSSAELTAVEAFAAFAIAFWAGAVFPITGSGLGVVDAVLIAMLIELGGADDDALVAAALLWRVFYSVITLPLGAITLSRFRRATPNVLRRLRT